jgi:hypothetical protein
MSQNKYIFNILDFFYEKCKKNFYKKFENFVKWVTNEMRTKNLWVWPTISQTLWPLAQQEWDKK